MVHHLNCTYCKHRISYKYNKSSGEIERCTLTNALIPHPDKNNRYCEQYQQRNCDCEKCNSKTTDVSH